MYETRVRVLAGEPYFHIDYVISCLSRLTYKEKAWERSIGIISQLTVKSALVLFIYLFIYLFIFCLFLALFFQFVCLLTGPLPIFEGKVLGTSIQEW